MLSGIGVCIVCIFVYWRFYSAFAMYNLKKHSVKNFIYPRNIFKLSFKIFIYPRNNIKLSFAFAIF